MKVSKILLLGLFFGVFSFQLQADNKPTKPTDNKTIKPSSQTKGSNQKKQETQTFSISNSRVDFNSSGGAKSVSVESSDNNWAISNGASDWYEANKIGNSIVIETKPNNSTSARDATVQVKDKSIRIYQSGASPVLNLSANRLNFRASGEEQQILITTNLESWNFKKDNNSQAWYDVRRQGNNIVIVCDPNRSPSSRSGTIQITTGKKDTDRTIEVNQAGTSLNISPSSLLFPSTGGVQAVNITTSGSSDWKVESISENWCKIESLSPQGFTVVCSENPRTALRHAEILITTGNITEKIIIQQSGLIASLNVNQNRINFSKSGGHSNSITVNTNLPNFEIDDLPNWCKVVSRTSSGFVISCESNKSFSRTESFRVKAGDKVERISVTQESGYRPNPFKLKNDHRTIGLSAGYVQKSWSFKLDDGTSGSYGMWDEEPLHGIQFGIRSDFYFSPDNHGLGIGTGLFYEYYYSQSETFTDYDYDVDFNATFQEHSLYVPVHLIYRHDFSENFSLFIKGGLGLDCGLFGSYEETVDGENSPYYTSDDIYGNTDFGDMKRFNLSSEFGGGFQIKKVLFDISLSKGLLNQTSGDGYTTKQNKGIMASLVFMY